MWAYNLLRTKHFHGVSSGNQHPYLLKSRYGKVSLLALQRHFRVLTKFAHVESRLSGRKLQRKVVFYAPANLCDRRPCSTSVAVGLIYSEWDRLRPQVVELTTFALTLLGPSGGVATNQSWASATRADRRDFSLCACPRERRGNSSTSASDRGDPGSHDDGGPDASAPHC